MRTGYYGRKNSHRNGIFMGSSRGSITVEAAFIMPIVIFFVFALIYFAFYLHDICRIQSKIDLVLYKAGITVKHEADIVTGHVDYKKIGSRGVFYLLLGSTNEEEKQVQNYLCQELEEGLFLVKVDKIDVTVEKQKIVVSVETGTQVSLKGIKDLFEPYSKIVRKGEYPVHNPAESIRCMEVILETGSGIKGMDKLKEKFERIFDSK
jgi:hypothetical protein